MSFSLFFIIYIYIFSLFYLEKILMMSFYFGIINGSDAVFEEFKLKLL